MGTQRSAKRDALRRLTAAARPYGLRVEKTPFSDLPELVLLRPADGFEVARLRFYDEDPGGPGGPGGPAFRSIFPHSVTHAEEAEIDKHLRRAVAPILEKVFSYPLWASLADADHEN